MTTPEYTRIRQSSADNYVLCLDLLREVRHQNSDTQERFTEKQTLDHAFSDVLSNGTFEMSRYDAIYTLVFSSRYIHWMLLFVKINLTDLLTTPGILWEETQKCLEYLAFFSYQGDKNTAPINLESFVLFTKQMFQLILIHLINMIVNESRNTLYGMPWTRDENYV